MHVFLAGTATVEVQDVLHDGLLLLGEWRRLLWVGLVVNVFADAVWDFVGGGGVAGEGMGVRLGLELAMKTFGCLCHGAEELAVCLRVQKEVPVVVEGSFLSGLRQVEQYLSS